MPEIRYYEIEQTRTVRVTANNEENALSTANLAFEGKTKKEVDGWGKTLGDVTITNVHISRELI